MHRAQGLQRALGGLDPLQDEAVDQPARQPHAHPDTGLRSRRQLLRDLVVEHAVQVRNRGEQGDAGHGQRLGRRMAQPDAWRPPRRSRLVGEQRDLALGHGALPAPPSGMAQCVNERVTCMPSRS